MDADEMTNLRENIRKAWRQNDQNNLLDMTDLLLKLEDADNPRNEDLKRMQRAQKEAPLIIEQILQDLKTGKKEPIVTYEMPDQSPLQLDDKGMLLDFQWGSRMDLPGFRPDLGDMKYFSPWFWALYLGNYDDFMAIVKTKSKSELRKLLKRRESFLQLSAIFLPVMGCQVYFSYSAESLETVRESKGKIERKYIQILKKLLELGADINDRDIMGCTPLHLCLSGPFRGNDVTFSIAEYLLQQGADPNAANRVGDAPLFTSSSCNNLENIELLIKYKADPLLKNNEGMNALAFAKHHPGIHQRLLQGVNDTIEKERKAAKKKGDLKVCHMCSKDAEKRCTGCFLVWYCGRKCQQYDWKDHSKECKQSRSEYEEVQMIDRYMTTISMREGKMDGVFQGNALKPKVAQFVVKIQLPLDGQGDLLCYNKEKDVKYMISRGSTLGAKISNAILNNDSRMMMKGYFYSIIRDGKHFINPKILPPETW